MWHLTNSNMQNLMVVFTFKPETPVLGNEGKQEAIIALQPY